MRLTGRSESTVNIYAKPWRKERGIVSYQRRQQNIETLLTNDSSLTNADLQRRTGFSLAACAKYADSWRAAHHVAPPVKPARTEKKIYRRSKPSKLKHPPSISQDQRQWHLAQFLILPELARRCLLYWIKQAIMPADYLEDRNSLALRRDFIDSAGFAISEDAFKGAMLMCEYDPRDGSLKHWQFYIQRKEENAQEPGSYIPPGRDAIFEAMCDQIDRYVDEHGLLYEHQQDAEGEEGESENTITPDPVPVSRSRTKAVV